MFLGKDLLLSQKHFLCTICGAFIVLQIFLSIAQGQALFSQSSQSEYYRELYLQGEYQKALDLLNQEMEARPELAAVKAFRYILWLSDRANILFELGRIDEAVSDLEIAVDLHPEPAFILRLARLHQYRGRMDDYKAMLELAIQNSRIRWSFHSYEENILAWAQIAELRGENPKQIYSSIFKNLMEHAPNFSDGFCGAGDLAYRRGAYDLADQHYRKAIELNSVNLNALAGLVETYWQSNDPRLEEALQQLLQINPRHFRAKAVQAELLLDRGEANQALELLEESFAVNPNHLRLRSLQAAAYFLLDDPESLEQTLQRVLDFNPHFSDACHVPGRIASRHYRFREGIEFQRKALEINPDDVNARVQYGLDLLRIGEDEKGRRELETAFAADPYNVTAFNLLNLLDELFTFDRVQQGIFSLRTPQEEALVWSDEALALLDEAYAVYSEKYDIVLETPIHIQIFNDHDDFMVRSIGLPGAVEFMGICFGQLITMDSPTARTHLSMNWKSVLWHEFVHVITLQKTNNRMPRWISEGISVYEEKQKSPAWGQKLNPRYKQLIDLEEMPGITELESYFVTPKTPSHLMFGYYLSSEFVDFYIAQFGSGALSSALDKMGKGEDAAAALAESGRISLNQLNQAFREFINDRLSLLQNLPPVQKSQSLLQQISDPEKNQDQENAAWLASSSPFTDAMKEGDLAMRKKRWEDAERHYENAFRLFPDYTGAHAPLRQLTTLYEQTKRRNKLAETLWRRVNWDSLDFEAGQRLISYHQEEEDWDSTAKAAQFALSIDPFHLPSRQALFEAYKGLNQLQQALRESEKLMALDSSRKIDYQLERIQILLRLDDLQRAKTETLLLLEKHPHLWKAQEMLLKMVES
ncbi:MAG: hypothetical protein JXR73_04285 [Candidatus Omnitrophica bacterium]|nr:hypothetical protein [Candidatus Omnitrophota bacterium]